jgi:signal transduction histidine kinase
MHASLCVALAGEGEVYGFLCLRDERLRDAFSPEEVQLFAGLGNQLVTTIENSRMYLRMKERDRLVAMGEMAAGLAHEIRNPLAGLKGAAQYLQTEDVSEDGREMLQVIVDEANRLDVVVSQFLDYARPFELRAHLEPPNVVVAHTLSLLRAQKLPGNITLVEDLGGDLPPVSIDSARLTQVLLNLLQNAVQAMPAGGTLTVGTRQRPGRTGQPILEVAVTDTGPGIADPGKLFVPFYTTKPGGTGLGLAISRRIVDAHGGELVVESALGVGTTFSVRLPLGA